MATFFGEILPVISRAVYDEEDDEFVPIPKPLVIESSAENDTDAISCDCLIVTVGPTAWHFVEHYFDLSASNEVAVIKEIHDDDDNGYEVVSRSPKIVSSFHKASISEKKSVFASCNAYVPPEQLWPLVKKMLNFVRDFSEVFVLTSSTVQEYKCDDPSAVETPIVRCLSTVASPLGHPVFPILEQPNMLKNVVAAVMSLCHIRNIPAVAYVCYSENMHTDLSSVNAFERLLDTSQFNTDKTLKKSSKEIQRNIRNGYTNHHGLYT